MLCISLKLGTFRYVHQPSVKRDDVSIGRAAFFAPLILTSQVNLFPPSTRILSMIINRG